MLENYRSGSVWNNVKLFANALRATAERSQVKGYSTAHFYSILSLHLKIKKLLSPQETKWLFLRARSIEIKNERFDVEITILNEKLELVTLSHQVCFVLDSVQLADDETMRKDDKL